MSDRSQSKKTGSNGKTRILIVDDHPIYRQGITRLIETQSDLEVCGEAENTKDAIAIVEKIKPDLALVDISLNGANGLELVKSLKALRPQLLVLVFSMHDELIYGERALRAGAQGYLMKDQVVDHILDAIRKVCAGESYLSAAMSRILLEKMIDSSNGSTSPVDVLSDRELEVFQLLGKGRGTREIANALKLSVKTVETHREHLKKKLKIQSSPELMRVAVEWVLQGR